jgi:hypothetical protein
MCVVYYNVAHGASSPIALSHRRSRICSRSLIALVLLLQREKQHVMICSSFLAAAATSLCEVIKPRRLRAGAAAAAALLGTKITSLQDRQQCRSELLQ